MRGLWNQVGMISVRETLIKSLSLSFSSPIFGFLSAGSAVQMSSRKRSHPEP